jgi:hypothetical protein
MHGVSPLLAKYSGWKGPVGWTQFLAEQRAHTARRYERIGELLIQIDRVTAEAGIAALALKGAALHSMGLYTGGDRPMADIDLLVRPVDSERTALGLQALGFRQTGATWKERVFTPLHQRAPDNLGEHSDNDLKIELHERICERLPWRITDATDVIFPGKPRVGLNAYPSKAAMMIHLLLHAAGAMPNKALRLLQLHDIALLALRLSESDWNQVLVAGSAQRRLWWAYPPLKLVSRYYPTSIPDRVLESLARQCPWWLREIADRRTLYDVSYSYLWVSAFPGIEWSRSIAEATEYVASRLRPDAKHVEERDYVARTQTWAQDDWAKLSQNRRMLRWLFSRPMRPVTMHVVRSALGQVQ